ncbi:MAG TPA: hypothetical protein VFB45_21490 [Pseudolabrys sp.]|nr:hypothetical protein [Pseudolabrys sp.]
MADRISLGHIGFLFGGVTAAVVFIAIWIVGDHITGRLNFDDSSVTRTLR